MNNLYDKLGLTYLTNSMNFGDIKDYFYKFLPNNSILQKQESTK